MSTATYDIFLPGEYFFDLIYVGLEEFPTLGREIYSRDIVTTGGAMFITAVSLRRLGVQVGWPVCFGNDYYSEYVRQLAIAEGIDLTLAKQVEVPYRRITTSLPYQGERAFVTYTDPPPLDLDAFWLERMQQSRFTHLHLGGLMSIDQLKPLASLAKSRGATVSMDCQDVPNLHGVCVWKHLLSLVDVFMPNAREAMIITETDSVEKAAQKLMDWTPLVVVKDGRHGVCIGAEGTITHIPPIHVEKVVDTTGAGDCFNAGFLFGHVIQKAPLVVCGRYGNICGGLSVTQVGGATAAPTLDQLLLHYALNYGNP